MHKCNAITLDKACGDTKVVGDRAGHFVDRIIRQDTPLIMKRRGVSKRVDGKGISQYMRMYESALKPTWNSVDHPKKKIKKITGVIRLTIFVCEKSQSGRFRRDSRRPTGTICSLCDSCRKMNGPRGVFLTDA